MRAALYAPAASLALGLAFLAGCRSASGAAELEALCDETWEQALASDPLQATWLADPRHHGRLPDPSPEARAALDRELARLEQRAGAIDPARLSDPERVTLVLLQTDLDGRRTQLAIDLEAWTLDPLEGPQLALATIAPEQPLATERERQQWLERLAAVPAWLGAIGANQRRALAEGRVGTRRAAEKVLAQIRAFLASDPAVGPLITRAAAPDQPAGYGAAVEALVRERVRPAFAAWAALLEAEILPAARGDDHPGLVWLPGGAEQYRRLARLHTSLELDPEAIHTIGLEEVARIRAEAVELGRRVFGPAAAADFEAVQTRLRGDPAQFFASREEVLAKARECVERAAASLPRAFGRLPRAAIEVVPVPEHQERDTTIAYYRQPAPDGSRPGRYYVNASEPGTRPRYEAEVLAFHEALPGHHLQIAIAQEIPGLPALRRHTGSTAFVEGWALYTERLCDELGLYGSDLDRLGILSFDAWRASRLVVDTGIHALGWSRDRAVEYLSANTFLARNNVENEVDRYIAWPGQALAYKLGQREILALRGLAEERLGARFRLAEFHDRVLANGAVPLPILRAEITAWIESASRSAPPAAVR